MPEFKVSVSSFHILKNLYEPKSLDELPSMFFIKKSEVKLFLKPLLEEWLLLNFDNLVEERLSFSSRDLKVYSFLDFLKKNLIVQELCLVKNSSILVLWAWWVDSNTIGYVIKNLN